MRRSVPVVLIGLAIPLPTAVFAASNVTIVPLPTDCSSYPAYNSTSGQAGPWEVYADSTGRSDIDGLKVSAESFTNNGVDRYGFITLPKQSQFGFPTSRNTTIRCTPSGLQAQLLSDWVDLSVASEENWQRSLSFGLAGTQYPGIAIEPYAHYANGSRVPGVFLGARNTSTWNYKYNWGGNAGEYYLLRLADGWNPTLAKRQDFPVLDDRDWVGFLKVKEP